MSVRSLRRLPLVRDVSFDVHKGEILGFAGLMGSGRTETMRAIFGADRPHGGEIYLDGSATPARIRSPRHAVRQGIALLTEDRKDQGLLLPLPIKHNATLATMRAVSDLGTWIKTDRENELAQDSSQALSLRCRSIDQPVIQLSGGNQQKVVLSKWLLRDSRILIFDEPTRGIDVGAKFEIYRLMRELATRGKALIVVSSDLPELMHLCDRIAVMSAGKLVKVFERGQWTQDLIMHWALSEYQGAVA
jgi:ribose transport system ATP-binding protein